MFMVSSMVSRVVPGIADTMARSSLSRALSRGRLTRIGPAYDGGSTRFHHIAQVKRLDKIRDYFLNFYYQRTQFSMVGKFHIFFPEVELQFYEGSKINQLLSQVKMVCEKIRPSSALWPTHGSLQNPTQSNLHRLRLTKIQLTIQKKPSG